MAKIECAIKETCWRGHFGWCEVVLKPLDYDKHDPPLCFLPIIDSRTCDHEWDRTEESYCVKCGSPEHSSDGEGDNGSDGPP